jgi:sensor histidine kinase YesM
MERKLKNLLLGWFIHFGAIIVTMNIFHIFKYFGDSPYQRSTPWEFFVRHTFKDVDTLIMLVSLLFIEINYQYVFRKLRFPLFIGTSMLVGVLAFLTFMLLHYTKHNEKHLNFDQVLIIAAYALVYAIVRNYLHQIRYKKDLQLQQSKNELDALKAQINPHFLFNSLNYLYGTALNENAPTTADGIDKLSDMMRYTITGIHENFVPIEDEFKFIDHYLALQQARLPKREHIQIDIQISHTIRNRQIAPLLVLPFIENAFKYGISVDEPCFVTLKIEFVDDYLKVEINNSIVRAPIEIKGNNTGIKNTIKRLELLYPDRYDLKQTTNGNTYQTILSLSLLT